MSESGARFKSVLQIPRVVFDEITFKRLGFKTKNKAALKLRSTIEKIDDGEYRVTLRAIADCENEYELTVQVSGYCEINESDPNKEILLSQNAVAILFPFIRSELTLITAQPGTDPIVLPVMNISAMLKQSKTNQKEETPPVE